jgi:uncharacterized membrane protein
VHKVKLALGERDQRTGQFAVIDGLAEGDTVLRYPNTALKDGQLAKIESNNQAARVVAGK